MQRLVGEAAFHSATRSGGLSAYVSTQGRLFNRITLSNGRAQGSAERVGSEGNYSISFQGRSLVAVQMGEHGARRILVTFDPGFTTCTAEVIRGKEPGASSMVSNSLITPGNRTEIQSVKTTGVSCSTREGNVFGQ
jgi:hypothetical protein